MKNFLIPFEIGKSENFFEIKNESSRTIFFHHFFLKFIMSGIVPSKIQKAFYAMNENIRKSTAETDESDYQIQRVEQQRFIKVKKMDIDALISLFDSYATKKTYATGFFNLAMIANNFVQLKDIIDLGQTRKLDILNIIILLFVILSLVLQIVVGVVLIYLAKTNEFIDKEKRDQLIKRNNAVTFLPTLIPRFIFSFLFTKKQKSQKSIIELINAILFKTNRGKQLLDMLCQNL
ncbi:ninjurin-1-like isoform X1 [Brachionus plicatilis]|uniref:Ninjurin-1-like isoform X1 n=1 Tax=Brachionus plicatilis TaxID=10195 RepID=A0A3M7PSC0_BRAPC|nr:ninjurin-1-like isoform X1 [Brachionus plicatilis]